MDDSDYPGCDNTNFHYNGYCKCELFGGFYSSVDPAGWDYVSPPEGPWTESGAHGVPMPTDTGGTVWYAKRNLYVAVNEKDWTIELAGPSADKYGVQSVTGVQNGDPPQPVPVATVEGMETQPGPPKKRTIKIKLRPQPDYETVKLVRNSAGTDGPLYMKIKSYSFCKYVGTMGNYLYLEDARFGVPGEDHFRITEICVFPHEVPVDPIGLHHLTAPPQSGPWLSQPIHVDPESMPRFLGGIRWQSLGAGLTPEDLFWLSMAMLGMADSAYDLYALDANSGDWQEYLITVAQDVPCAIGLDCVLADDAQGAPCTCDACSTGFCSSTPIEFGNVDCSSNQQPNLDDILCTLAGFGNFAACPNADIAPTNGPNACKGDDVINLDDILAVLAAFGGSDPCNCQP